MGSLLVMFGWLIIAAAFAAIAAALVWVGQRRQPHAVRRRRAGVAAGLPLALLLWMFPAVLLWQGWGMLTGFEAEFLIGDSWDAALPNDYSLSFIDVADRASIYPPGGGEAVVSDITQIGVEAAVVFGIAAGAPFVLDTAARKSQHDFFALTTRVKLLPVDRFPGRALNPLDGLLWFTIAFVPPCLLARRLWTPRSVGTRDRPPRHFV